MIVAHASPECRRPFVFFRLASRFAVVAAAAAAPPQYRGGGNFVDGRAVTLR
jgi:hypothetical protein